MGIQYGIKKDTDVFNYFSRANITDPQAMKQIANFVKRVKSLRRVKSVKKSVLLI